MLVLAKTKTTSVTTKLFATHLRKSLVKQPVDRMAKKSIAGFKIRAGMNRVGISVTLRGARMYEFLDRLVKRCTATCS